MRVINWPHVLHFQPTDILPGITFCALMRTPFEILIGNALRTMLSPLTTTSPAAGAQSVAEWKRAVEFRHILSRQSNFNGTSILADVSCATGLWNRDNSILLKYQASAT
jgi:hypothetical protein